MITATYYHAGCPICRAAQDGLIGIIDPAKCSVEIVDLTVQPWRIPDAERQGVTSLPALVAEGTVFHINYGASLQEIKETCRHQGLTWQYAGCCCY